MLVPQPVAGQSVAPVDLRSAAAFAVLAGSGISNAGATTIYGDVGSSPTATFTGFETVSLNGTNHGGDSVTLLAKSDLALAYLDAASRQADTVYPPIFELNGLTLTPGVYSDPTSLLLNGTLILDGLSDVDSVWIFQIGSTLTTGANSSISLINGAQAANVFWQVGSSATLGAESSFAGTILARSAISLGSGATIDGRLLAQDGTVSLDRNVVPEPGVLTLILFGLLFFFACKRSIRGSRPTRR